MTQTESRAVSPSASSTATLEAMALLARQAGTVVHVVVPREPGTVEATRGIARAAGIQVTIDLMPYTLRVRFDGA